jgi:hypothetical protein
MLKIACYRLRMESDLKHEFQDERRDAPRVDLEGRYSMRLDPGDGREPMVCQMLDYSVTGVRLQLPDEVNLPKDVQILIGNLSHNARVVWRKNNVIGVDFIDEHHSIY